MSKSGCHALAAADDAVSLRDRDGGLGVSSPISRCSPSERMPEPPMTFLRRMMELAAAADMAPQTPQDVLTIG